MRTRLLIVASVAALTATQLVAAGPVAAALAGLQKIVAVSGLTSDAKVTVASCPTGKVVVGGGGIVSGSGSPLAHLVAVRPVNGGSGFEAQATEVEGGTPLTWRLEAIAICAVPPPGLAYVESAPTFVEPRGTHAGAEAGCGRAAVLGVGGYIVGGDGQVAFDSIAPHPQLTSVVATAYEDWNGYREGWSIVAYAICADRTPDLNLATDIGLYDQSSPKSNGELCPATNAYSAGFWIVNSNGYLLVGAVSLGDLLGVSPHSGVAAGRHPTAPIDDWGIVVYAICGS